MRDELIELVERALSEGKWIVAAGGIWFSPAELRQANAEGRFIWDLDNFELVDPKKRVRELQAKVSLAQDELTSFERRL